MAVPIHSTKTKKLFAATDTANFLTLYLTYPGLLRNVMISVKKFQIGKSENKEFIFHSFEHI